MLYEFIFEAAPASGSIGARSASGPGFSPTSLTRMFLHGQDPKRTRQMIRLADGVVFDYVVPIFNMVTSTAKDSNGA